MENQKGFTLVEILAVIVILGLLFAIGIPSFMYISNNIKQSNLENKRTYALSKAEEWASNTGRSVVNIAHLIEEGYMEPDNERGEYQNPVTGESMLCDTIRIDTVQNQFVASYSDEVYCDYQELEEQTTIIQIVQKNENGDVLPEDSWTRNNVVLAVQFKEQRDYDLYKNSVVKVEWRGNNQSESKPVNRNFDQNNTFLVRATQFIYVQYEATVTIVHEDKTYVYKAYTQVKIDRQNPIIYQDDVAIENFDGWQSGTKTTHIVTSDYDGSGVYGYYYTDVSNGCSMNRDDYTRLASLTFDLELSKGDYHVCVMDNVGNISDPALISVLKIDDVSPIVTDFSIASSAKGNTYYRELTLGVTVQDELSGANAIRYCFTTEDTCVPEHMKKVDANGYVTISYEQPHERAQRICLVGLDQASNESALKCSEAYLFDNTGPDIISFRANRVGLNYQASFEAEDVQSRMYQFQIKLGTSKENQQVVYTSTSTNTSGTFNLKDLVNNVLQDLKANTNYVVTLEAMNQAGIVTTKDLEGGLTTSYSIMDALSKCDLRDGYCNQGIYVKYGENIFVLYRNTSNSVFGLNVSNNMRTSIINDFCCDQGTCVEENVYNTSWSGIYSEDKGSDNTLRIYYNKLPQTDKYLNKETYTFGVVQGDVDATGDVISNGRYVSKKSMQTNYGLLDYGEYQKIQNKSYMNNVGTLLSTVFTICLSNDHYECNNDVDNITGIYALNGVIRTQSAVTGQHHDINVNAAMTVPFKNTIVFIGGNGTYEDPYIVL